MSFTIYYLPLISFDTSAFLNLEGIFFSYRPSLPVPHPHHHKYHISSRVTISS